MENVLKQAEKDGIKFITLQFTDLLGVIKEVIVPVEELGDALADGVWFDGSSIEGFARIQESDLFLKPDTATYAVVPWLTEEGKTARLICDSYRADGKPFEGDPRYILKQAMAEAEKEGFVYNVGPEPEFYLFRADSEKRKSPIAGLLKEQRTTPIDYGSYFDLSSHEGYKVIKKIISALENFGIKVEASHHEVGLGQYEIDFHYGDCLDIADVHQSLFDTKANANAFYDKEHKYNLSKTASNFIAGQIKHINAMCAILCPTVNSYKRLVSGFEAPVYVTWAAMNRSALLRVPKWFIEKHEAARIELRCPDPSCNPYLAFAVMLKAGLDGIKNNLEPPEPVEENIYSLDDESRVQRNIDVLPTSLSEALEALKKDEVLQETLGSHLYERYIDVKTKEWDEFKKQVTNWEIDTYLDTF